MNTWTLRFGCLAFCVLTFGCGNNESNNSSDDGPPPKTCDEVNRTQMADVLTKDDVDLSGTYRISGRTIYDAGQKVNIAPGTVFLMEPDSRLYFGWRNDPATVYARGTEAAPILFCGTAKKAGHWKDIQILGGTTTDSTLEHVRIEDAGGAEGSNDVDAAFVLSVALKINHLTILDSSSIGAEMAALATGSTNFTIKGHKKQALKLTGPTAISNLPEGDYTGNGEDVALVDGYENTNVIFNDRGIPYRQIKERIVFGIAGGMLSSITFNAGVTYQFCQDCFMLVGWRSDPGQIISKGTAEKPVTLTSAQPDPMPGDWNGLSLLGGTTSDSIIEHTNFEYGGKTMQGNLIIDGGLGSISKSSFSNSAGAGILVESREAGLEIASDNEYTMNAEGDLVEPE